MGTTIKKSLVTIFSIAMLSIGSKTSAALTFYSISGVTSSTSATDFYNVNNLIQGSGAGFDNTAPYNAIAGAGSSFLWTTNAPNGGTGDYFANSTPSPVLVFDLGSSVPLFEINIWNYLVNNGNGTKSFNLRFSNSTTFSGAAVESFSGVAVDPTIRQNFVFTGGAVTARYVELEITDNHFGTLSLPGGDRVGLGEVSFVVPEPATSFLFILGASTLLIRRRR